MGTHAPHRGEQRPDYTGRPAVRTAAESKPRVSTPEDLIRYIGGSHAAELGIRLQERAPAELNKWLVAAMLFGARIGEDIAVRTYRALEEAGLLAPQALLAAGWDRVVAVLDHGGYARYDFKTATKLLAAAQALVERYDGDLNALHDAARNERDLEALLKSVAKGIGAVTANIFLRELRGIWPKAEPPVSPRAARAARALGFVPSHVTAERATLEHLQEAWAGTADDLRFADFEAALIRFEATARKKRRGLHRRRPRVARLTAPE